MNLTQPIFLLLFLLSNFIPAQHDFDLKLMQRRHQTNVLNVSSYQSPSRSQNSFDEGILIKFAGGLSHPVGAFAKTSLLYDASGFAKNGYVIQATGIFKINKYFGVFLGFHSQSNAFDNESFTSRIRKPSNVVLNCTSTNWKIQGLLYGLDITLPLAGRPLAFDLQFGLGAPKHTSPEIAVTANKALWVSQSAGISKSLTAWLGAGFKIALPDNILIGLQSGLMMSNPRFQDVAVSSGGTVTRETVGQKIRTLSLQITFALVLANL